MAAEREKELEALLSEATLYLIASVAALKKLGVDMTEQTEPFLADVKRALGVDLTAA